MSLLSDILSILAILLTLGQLIYLIIEHFIKKRTINPTIEINIENPPPYKDVTDTTLILIKNVGTSIAYEPKLEIYLSFLDYNIKKKLNGMISIEQTIEEKIRLPESPFDTFSTNMIFDVTVKTSKRAKERLKFSKSIKTISKKDFLSIKKS